MQIAWVGGTYTCLGVCFLSTVFFEEMGRSRKKENASAFSAIGKRESVFQKPECPQVLSEEFLGEVITTADALDLIKENSA